MRRRTRKMNSNNKLFAAILLLCVAVASCGPLGKYEADNTVDENLYGRGVETLDTLVAPIEWKQMFCDTCLQNLIQRALDKNIDLQVAYQNVLQADANLQQSKLAYVPTLNMQQPYVSWGGSTGGVTGSSFSYGVPMSTTWEVDIFGRLANRKDLAKASKAQAEDYRQAVRVSLIASVADTYYLLLMLDDQLRTALEMEATWKESVETIHAMKREGFADEVAVNQYESTYAGIRATTLSLLDNINIAENNMSLLLDTTCISIQRGKLSEQQVPEIAIGVPVGLLTYRPDVRASQRQVEMAFYTTKDAWLNFFPKLSITGDGLLTNIINGAIVPFTALGSLGANLVVPIFNQGVNKAKLKIAQSQQEQARLNFDKAMLTAGVEVNNALNSYKCCTEKEPFYQTQVVCLTNARNDTDLLMRNSQDKTYLDVLTAHNALIEATFTHIENRSDRFRALVSLYSALGGGSEY